MRIDLCVGSAISPERCRRIGSDTHLAAFLRLSAYLLQLRHAPSRTHTALREAIAPPIEAGVLRRYMSPRVGGLQPAPSPARGLHGGRSGRLSYATKLTLTLEVCAVPAAGASLQANWRPFRAAKV